LTQKIKSRLGSVQQRSSVTRILIILWLLVIVGAILLIKATPFSEILSGSEAKSLSTLEPEITERLDVGIPEHTQAIEYPEIPEKTQSSEYSQTPEYSKTPEFSQDEVATIAPEYSSVPEFPQTGASPAEQYKSAIANRKPTLVFFHSNTCKSCLEMIDTVNEVYPEFFHLVVLIDVNVYDPQNEDLVNRVGINLIPTLVFYNQKGDSLFSIGVISSDELRQKLGDISEGKIP
jgi:thiol-disulfide isomerase/thioredoxin